MEATLHALGGMLLRALPTFFLVVLLHFYLKAMFFKPLEKVLHRRYELNEGARKLADASLAKAEEKAAEYETKMRAARTDVYREQEELRRQLQEERTSQVQTAREHSHGAIARAKADLAAEVQSQRKELAAESENLSRTITASLLRGKVA
ncbi:MAG: hypothetical protein ABIZ80_15240 [Bryobacteraceae bacterium]